MGRREGVVKSSVCALRGGGGVGVVQDTMIWEGT